MNVEFFIPESEKQIVERGKNVDFIISPSHTVKLGAKVFDGLQHLKVLQLTGAGFDNVDLAAAARRDIPVAHAPGQNTRSVAQYVFIMAGILLRRMLEGHQLVFQGQYQQARKTLTTPTLHEFGGQNLGIIGMGRIGREVARIGRFFGYHIGYYDIRKLAPEDEAGLEATYFDREAICKWADVITLHIPLTPDTRSMIGKSEFNRMKPRTILINVSRGGIVDEDALCEALLDGRLQGAAVDVFNQEPPPGDHPFFDLEPAVRHRLLLSSHMGGKTYEANQRMYSFAVENVRAYLVDGKPLKYRLNYDELNKET
jgi:lactate dehydrogenase-like 2-hydroxyacid dehydrogenase